jgi:SAM-dependent methyltransferase
LQMKNKNLPNTEKEHPFHSMCTYLGRFPPQVPRRILQRWIAPRTRVLDPFCGVGTTLVEAALRGHDAIGVDLNPLAVAITRAKATPVSLVDVQYRLTELAGEFDGGDLHDADDDISVFFHPRTLAQLCYLRRHLQKDRPEDVFITGTLLGIMHGKHRKGGGTAYLSIDMPNTFSMSPEYVRRFVREKGLTQPPVDVFGKLRERSAWLLRRGPLSSAARLSVFEGDATKLREILGADGVQSVGAIVSSPPYLGILRYGAFNWLRLWFLGLRPADIDRLLDGTDSLDRYLSFMTNLLKSCAEILRPGAIVALVIGDVVEASQHVALAERLWAEVDGVVPFRLEHVEADQYDVASKSTRIWGEDRKGQATPMDRVLVLSRITHKARLAPATRSKARATKKRRQEQPRS